MPPQQQNMAVEQPVLPRTKTVSIENLAASTTEQQLKSLCRGIGVLEASQTHFICLNPAILDHCNWSPLCLTLYVVSDSVQIWLLLVCQVVFIYSVKINAFFCDCNIWTNIIITHIKHSQLKIVHAVVWNDLSDISVPRIWDSSVAILACPVDVVRNQKLHVHFLATSVPENCHNL
jgi:hypothetical protein